MEKRTFLKIASALAATPLVSRLLAWGTPEKLTNWAGNLEYSTDRLYSAQSFEQVRQFVKEQSRLKVLGTRHCFNNIADSVDGFLSMPSMDKETSLDKHARTVTVEAGTRYGQLCPHLDEQGLALHKLTPLPYISIAGDGSTVMQKSGVRNGNMWTTD